MLWIAEIYYVNARDISPILLRVVADSKRDAEYKVGKYIERKLQGQRCYRVGRFDMIEEI